jgi:hypothetical protein
MEGKWASDPSTNSGFLTHADSPPCKVLPTGEAPPVAPQRSTSPYTILRSPGPLRIVVSGESAYELSTAQRLANDLFVYHKLDAEIVLETEYLETQGVTRPGIGNIIVIGGPSGQYIRQCLTKRRTAFSIEVGEDGSPVLQLRGQKLGGSSQGTVT